MIGKDWLLKAVKIVVKGNHLPGRVIRPTLKRCV